MVTVTKAAAEQIRKSAQEGDMEGLALRVAAKRKDDGGIDYGMGFDEPTDEDVLFNTEGVKVVVSPAHVHLLNGASMDFVEIEGEHRFIFLNPNDPHYRPPSE
jgi:iron-sulfur cluster assembly protein